MPDLASLLVFSVACLALLVVPGPAVLYIVTRSAADGRRAGLVSVLGIHLATLVHIAAAVVGLSAVLAASSTAFTVVKLAGAAYLVALGVRAWASASSHEEVGVQPMRSMSRTFSQGFVVNLLNPKTALFFLAFVPQFVPSTSGTPTRAIVLLGLVFVVLGLISDGAYAVAGSAVSRRLRRVDPRRQGRAVGAIYVGLGVATALGGGAD